MPKIIDVNEARMRIVGAAWRVIATRGIQAASFRHVAIEAGCTRGLITHYFKDKNELVTFAYRKVLDQMLLDAQAAIDGCTTVPDKLVAAIEAVEPTQAGDRDFTIVLLNFWAAAAYNSEFAAQCREDYRLWWKTIGEVIADGVKTGQLRSDTDIKLLTDTLTLLADGLSVGLTLLPARYPKRDRRSIIEQALAPYMEHSLRVAKRSRARRRATAR